jgi:hypothetical protein
MRTRKVGMSTGLKSINVMAELDRLGVKWSHIGDDEVRVPCPCHDDTSPSASLNVVDHVFKCFVPSCNAHGDFVSFIAYTMKMPRNVVMADLQKRYPNIEGIAEIPSQTVEKFHSQLKNAGPLLMELKKRGVTEEMMRAARLGFHDGRITIPVFDEVGRCRNVRRYLPGAPGPQKMRNTTNHGAAMLYRADTIKGCDTVMVCAGEMKALVAGSLLEPHGIAAVCTTGGEGHWKDSWSDLFEGKNAVVCYDVDDAGVQGARRVAMALHHKAKTVKVLQLPLDKKVHPKGDINDWVGQCGATAADFVELISRCPLWGPPVRDVVRKGDPRRLPLDSAISNSNVGELVEIDAVVAASDTTPFLVPKDVDVECTRNAKYCHLCPVKHLPVDMSGWSRVTVDPGSPAILGMLGATDKDQAERMKDCLGIPPCAEVKFHPRTHHVANDVRLSPPIDVHGDRVGDAWYPAVIIASQVPELSVPCRMRGSVHPHPRTQQAVALISEHHELEDTLSKFKCTDEEVAELSRCFSAADSLEGLERKVKILCDDLASNVTWIYRRPDLHVAVDLTFHSVLNINYGGRPINGWMQTLIIGDSAQGKSECMNRMMAHYGVGDKLDCKNATVAGLLGGLEQLGNRWFVRWGAIPRRDRMLVGLEELKGASTEVLCKLTEMRSSGVAEIPKIERRKALARTRILANSNPRSPRPMSKFNYGVQAIHELIGALEDVRRFDLALAVGQGEVSEDVINVTNEKRPKCEHAAKAAISRKLILWAWTRSAEQVVISDATDAAIMEVSGALTRKFDEAIPLVDKGTIRQKVARMSAAIAARTFSSPDGHQLLVKPQHAQFIGRFLDRVYSSKVMGYDAFSEAHRMMSSVQDPDVVENAIRSTKHPADLAGVLMRRDTISGDDLQSAAEVDWDGAKTLLSLLVRKGALLRMTRNEYAKSPDFIEILKRVRSDPAGDKQEVQKGRKF